MMASKGAHNGYRDVLLVEDEPVFRGLIARNLRSRGLLVREAESADRAVREVIAAHPDLMLLDLNLPDHSGWDVLRELRQRSIEVPTIVVSAVRVPASRLKEFGPLGYLPKPFPLEALLRPVVGGESDDGRAESSESD